MTTNEKALLLHREWQGKLETVSKAKVATREDLALAYTPGVAEPCRVIAGDKDEAYNYTWNNVIPTAKAAAELSDLFVLISSSYKGHLTSFSSS